MADVKEVPRISCDNCGATVFKTEVKGFNSRDPVTYAKPKAWGGCRIEGTRDADQYGNKERLDFTDLCERCAHAVFIHAAGALEHARGEHAED